MLLDKSGTQHTTCAESSDKQDFVQSQRGWSGEETVTVGKWLLCFIFIFGTLVTSFRDLSRLFYVGDWSSIKFVLLNKKKSCVTLTASDK